MQFNVLIHTRSQFYLPLKNEPYLSLLPSLTASPPFGKKIKFSHTPLLYTPLPSVGPGVDPGV